MPLRTEMCAGNWNRSSNRFRGRSVLPVTKHSKTAPVTRSVTKSGWKKSRTGFRCFKVSKFKKSSQMRIALHSIVLGAIAIAVLLSVAAKAQIAGESPELERVLAQMDATAKKFGSAEANVVWD